ncbi:E3 ubiquitin-protein ligase RFWD3-like [Iris pallida]|uniref:E3 ubiquitin-protein ligase RFWD3-like n=1 Tax=Iris pallida TaxID=29817 RepID=A0AAX6HJG9_IRIPA|nr:E3 ubiquitin-protein ligase RFWD3-like [Iris pallida]
MDIITLYAPVNVVPNDSPKDLCSNENNGSLKSLSAQQDLKPRILEEKPLIRFTMGSDRLDASSSVDVTMTTEATMSRITQLEERVAAIEAQMPRIANLEAQVSQLVDLQSEMAELRNEIVELRNKMTEMQTEMVELRNSVAEVRRICDNMHGIEAPVQVAKRRRL